MIGAIIQARTDSARLPKKVLEKIEGKTVLEHVILRTKRIRNCRKVILATTNKKRDDILEKIGKRLNVLVFRGSEDNVLDRYYQVARLFKIDPIVRITSDCPLLDSEVAEKVIDFYLRGHYDYVSNVHPPTFPDGLDVEVFSFEALKKSWQGAKTPHEKEHIVPYMLATNPQLFKRGNVASDKDFSYLRITLDEKDDLTLIRRIYKELYAQNPFFGLEDILALFETKPELIKINQHLMHWTIKIKKGIDLWNKAKKLIPGGGQLLSKRPEMFLPDRWPSYFNKAKGVEVWDLDGNKYIDMSSMAVGSCILGYADSDVAKSVKKVIDEGSMSTLNSPEEIELAELLLGLHPWAEMVRYARTGGEVMAIAVRIARAYTGKEKLCFCGYHGWSDWYLSANLADDKNLDGHLLPGLEPKGVPRGLKGTAIPFHYNKIGELKRIIKENDIGAIIMEPRREHQPKKAFLKEVRRLANQIGAILIFDEITSGWRMNIGGIHMLYKVYPDIAVFAKAISNGYPMAAVIGRKKVMQAAQTTFISSTYWTERIGPTAAIATIKKLRKYNVPSHLVKIGNLISAGWQRLAEKHKLDIGIFNPPPLISFKFKQGKDSQALHTLFTQEMLKRGYLASKSVYVSYSHKRNHIEEYLRNTDEVFGIIKKAIEKRRVYTLLKGPIAHTGFKRLT